MTIFGNLFFCVQRGNVVKTAVLSVGRKMTPFPETVSDPKDLTFKIMEKRGSLTVSGNGVIFLSTLKNK